MSKRKVLHDSFSIERVYPASPARVFKAWASIEAKARWFIGPADWKQHKRELDFRIGGLEVLSGQMGEKVHHFHAVYHDIVQDQRIVYSYHMLLDDTPISVSPATVQIEPAGKGTRLVFTEQCAFLDDFEDGGGREEGTGQLLDRLGQWLAH